MQDSLAPLPIQLLGVNQAGYESGNAGICAGRDLPWLQETADQPVWTAWNVDYRDLVVLDADNYPLFRYNLTDNDLGDPDRFEELKGLLEGAAGG